LSTTDILLITPPFTQLNTPYPATIFLKGFLKNHGFNAAQLDLGIETILDVFSTNGMTELFGYLENKNLRLSANARRMVALKHEYIGAIEPVIAFLQGNDSSLAQQICGDFLPQASRFNQLIDLEWNFGELGVTDQAKYLATLFIEDIGDFIAETIDPNFGFSRYAEKLSLRIDQFEQVEGALSHETPVTQTMIRILNRAMERYQPKIVAFTVPFPGNLFSALKSAQFLKTNFSSVPIIMGGGFVNTELRELNEIRLFHYFDYVCLDDGERPLLQLLNHLLLGQSKELLVRTFYAKNEGIKFENDKEFTDFSHDEIGMPDYEGLPLDHYISVLEIANPMHRLWTDGRWNKLALAHGCYWHKCSFCDVSLDYIKRFSKAETTTLCNRIETAIAQTKQRGFHFVDEAAPPAVLRDLAIELLKRQLKITWWANIRFENAFTADLCRLLAESGCIAVSGGLEVASDRLLALMQKGVTIEQVVKVTSNLTRSGIMVHAYLMYGFPTETEQETIDSLEVVRQLFENELIKSAFWHRFALTAHSPVAQFPEQYKVTAYPRPNDAFAINELDFKDIAGCVHEKFGFGLKKALYNYMHGLCFNYQMQNWFEFKIPCTTIPPNLVSGLLKHQAERESSSKRVLWLGSLPGTAKGKKGLTRLFFDTKKDSFVLEMTEHEAIWLIDALRKIHWAASTDVSVEDLERSYIQFVKQEWKNFTLSKNWKMLRKNGLLIL